MFKNFFNKCRSEVRTLISLFIFTLFIGTLCIASIVCGGNADKLQDDNIVKNLFLFTNLYGFSLAFHNSFTGRAKNLPLVISAVSVAALFIVVCVRG
jgi:hypothetical protein